MNYSQIRREARSSLSRKWGKAALLTLVYTIIYSLISFGLSAISGLIPFLSLFFTIGIYAVTVPIVFGFTVSLIKLRRGEEVHCLDFLDFGFSKFKQVWCTIGNIIKKMIVPIAVVLIAFLLLFLGIFSMAFSVALQSSFIFIGSLTFIIIGFAGYITGLILLVPKSYSYMLSYYILYDNPDMPAKEIVEKSERLMIGYRFKAFVLSFTFFGWILLAILTLGIGMLWLLPYMAIAIIIFYEKRLQDSGESYGTTVDTAKVEVIDENNNPIQ
ncbi:MAG TPA: DUF975 family protein [Candidatus Merdicola faecigallinarum]|uniref:DUF975 family protein n=1 Tax=Candidatus Merdicola faecigallinarum TaxID=2840862 RepID=A0A9D1SA14_9FIRM|nr:DUF975 family protein [Candidatus Merdicola faecigallinarum]